MIVLLSGPIFTPKDTSTSTPNALRVLAMAVTGSRSFIVVTMQNTILLQARKKSKLLYLPSQTNIMIRNLSRDLGPTWDAFAPV